MCHDITNEVRKKGHQSCSKSSRARGRKWPFGMNLVRKKKNPTPVDASLVTHMYCEINRWIG